MTDACEYCGGPLPISNIPGGRKSETPRPAQIHQISATGPNGTFTASFTPDEWMDRSATGRAAKLAAIKLVHQQAGQVWWL